MSKIPFLITGAFGALAIVIVVLGLGYVIAGYQFGAELRHYRHYVVENDLGYRVRITSYRDCDDIGSFKPCNAWIESGGITKMEGWSEWKQREVIKVIGPNESSETRCFEYFPKDNSKIDLYTPKWWAVWETKKVTISSKLSQHPIVTEFDYAGRPDCW